MNKKLIPFSLEQIYKLIKKRPTPFYVYDEKGIQNSIRNLYKDFSWNSGFSVYFPIKSIVNPEIIKILAGEGCNADCCSVPELMISEAVGLKEAQIMFTSNDTSPEEFRLAMKMNTIINLDDQNHLEYLEKVSGLPDILSLRYNPGPSMWKNLKDDKFGMTKDQLLNTFKKAKSKGIKRFGLHMMIMSNDLNGQHLIDTARICFDIAIELHKLGIDLEFIDLGGGAGIPYRPNRKPIDMKSVSWAIKSIYDDLISKHGLSPFRIIMECGRYIVGQHGYLISRVRHIKISYKTFAGIDASMSDLMRPGMYGSYHHISVLGKKRNDKVIYDVVGSLCENNDKFAINRLLPRLAVGDVVVIHDVGAYGRSKVFDFNGKLRPAEFLFFKNNTFKQIRRAEQPKDYFRTITGWKVKANKLVRI